MNKTARIIIIQALYDLEILKAYDTKFNEEYRWSELERSLGLSDMDFCREVHTVIDTDEMLNPDEQLRRMVMLRMVNTYASREVGFVNVWDEALYEEFNDVVD